MSVSRNESLNILIGLEIHCQLTAVNTKLFCSCSSDYREKEPNSVICPVCMGLPGTLPVLSRSAIEKGMVLALALGCTPVTRLRFFRKNYFYPDLPKNYQITQYDKGGGSPLAYDGAIKISDSRSIQVTRVNLEEDPGRLTYQGSIQSSPYSLVDYNRAGVVLAEVVTAPDLRSPAEARAALEYVQSILEHLSSFDSSLDGSIRCDANVSLSGGHRIEVKNITSFKDVERALSFEITRQKGLLQKGITIKKETRHWDERRRITVSLRAKEDEAEYRYFPEPDLLPITISKKELSGLKATMPELPTAKAKRFTDEYGISLESANTLVRAKGFADLFEQSYKELKKNSDKLANLLSVDLLGVLNRSETDLADTKITSKQIVRLLKLELSGVIGGPVSKNLLMNLVKTGKLPDQITGEKTKITDKKLLDEAIRTAFKSAPKAVSDAKTNDNAVNYLLGLIMNLTNGRADPKEALSLIKIALENSSPESGQPKSQ
ncbi:MAG: Asp-tRNA(Asn)/Glu-tRNA(Gln) amidotransferase subunit GatB [Nitrososphaerales archaeon]